MSRKYRLSQVLIALILLFQGTGLAQNNFQVDRKNKVFFGIYGGTNVTNVQVKESYHVLTPTSEMDLNGEKTYGKMFNNWSSQFGFKIMYGFSKHISVVVEPGVYSQRFHYLTNYAWQDTVDFMGFSKELRFNTTLTYFTIPLYIRWDMLKKQFTPFVQVGGFFDFRYKTQKTVFVDGVIDGEVDVDNSDLKTAEVSWNDYVNKNNYGIAGGLGFSYFSKYVVISLAVNYKLGLKPLFNERNRYSDIAGFSSQFLDVDDRIKLGSLNAQLSLMIPLSSMEYLKILRRTKY